MGEDKELITVEPLPVRSKGRKSGYKPELPKELLDYFVKHSDDEGMYKVERDVKGKRTEVPRMLPTIGRFCREKGISVMSLYRWRTQYPALDEAMKEAKEMQTEVVLQNMLRGGYNAIGSIFTLKNLSGWKDKSIDASEDKPVIEFNREQIITVIVDTLRIAQMLKDKKKDQEPIKVLEAHVTDSN